MNVSPTFSPPMRIMGPYFIVAGVFYLLSMFSLLFLDITCNLHDLNLVAWVHQFMLGFVMMSIFAAMAQLAPIVVEANHRFMSFFNIIWILLLLGLVVMLIGFYVSVAFLPFGGILVLTAMVLFAVDLWLTLKSGRRRTSVISSMKASNFFLLFGVLSGVMMALFYSGVELNATRWYNIHVFSLIGGFVLMIIMGVSTVLVPMFGYSKRVSDNDFELSFKTMFLGVMVMITGSLFQIESLEKISILFMMASVAFYFYQLFHMFTSRARVEHDVWAKSMYVGFGSLALAWLFIVLSFLGVSELLKPGLWLLLVGFMGFLIFGNFYKIIPFLVWFQRYSPLVGEQEVPMLHELVNQKMASMQLTFSSLGLFITTIALLIQNQLLFSIGSTLLIVGAVFMLVQIVKIIKN